VASRCGARIAQTRRMATLQGNNTVVEQGKHKFNDYEFIAYRYTAPTAADKPCVVFLHGRHEEWGTRVYCMMCVCTRWPATLHMWSTLRYIFRLIVCSLPVQGYAAT
jgi:hypothetical protein